MSVNIVPQWAIQQYNTNVALLSQQKKSRLRAAVTEGAYVGETASPVDQVGTVEMLEVVERFGPMPRVDANLDRRWVAPLPSHLPQLVDNFDKLKILLTDPKSWLVQAGVAAANRKLDDRIIGAFFSTALTGKTGATSTAFDATNQVVSVNTGGTDSALNVAKLEKGRSILLTNEVGLEEEEVHVAVTAKDELALRSEIQIISMDFNEKPIFNDKGLIISWRGFQFHHSERAGMTAEATDDAAGSSRQVPMWIRSGMHLGIWADIQTAVDQRTDLTSRPWQVYTTLTSGGTRLEEKKVVKIWCGQ